MFKSPLALSALVAILLLLAPIVHAQDAAPASTRTRPWTILVYGAADNNADGPIIGFLDRVRRAIDNDPGINLLVFIDRSEGYSNDDKFFGENFTGARLYRIRRGIAQQLPGGEHFPEITLDDDVELNSADAANIGKFIAWGKATAPADRYALLIYSHADGRTMCPDEECKGEMGFAELTDKVGAEGRVDFLALELCGMGGIEIAYQWRPEYGRFSADVLLAIPNAGPPLDWDRAFARIRTVGHEAAGEAGPTLDPAKMTAADFGRLVVAQGYAGRKAAAERGRNVAQEAAAAYDLARASDVKKAVDAFAKALGARDQKAALLALRDGAIRYSDDGSFVDLYDLCKRASTGEALSPETRSAATAVMKSVDDFVLDSFGMDGYAGFEPGKSGVFIVLPPAADVAWRGFNWYTGAPASGVHYGRWAFLKDGATPDDGRVETWYELVDSWFDNGDTNGFRP